jgi:hypothetical protein
VDVIQEKMATLTFLLRMGFDTESGTEVRAPISGLLSRPLPATLKAACQGLDIEEDDISEAVEGGKEMQKQHGSALTAEMYAAILFYTGDAIYADLNAALRSEDRRKVKQYMSYLRLLLEALCRLPPLAKTVWRGIQANVDSLAVGQRITWWGFSSCTDSEDVAKSFMKASNGKGTLFRIHALNYINISEVSFYNHEREHLLTAGTRLEVVSRKTVGAGWFSSGKYTEVELRELPAAGA